MKIKKRKQFYNIEKHGITQSLISMWLECRQKAKFYLQGWDSIYHKLCLTYGTVGHEVLDHAYSDIIINKNKVNPGKKEIKKYAKRVEKQWLKENPRTDRYGLEYLEYSLALIEVILPLYFDYYKKDLKKIKWLGLEEKFNQKFVLPDGRKTRLTGKKDGEFRKHGGLWLFESKFKSQINANDIIDTLAIDTQVLFYLRALKNIYSEVPEGVIYNIVRRPCLNQKKGESLLKFSLRIKKDVEDRPDFYFQRFPNAIVDFDLKKFEKDLVGIIKDFYDWWEGKVPHYKNTYSCVGKYGRCLFLPTCSSGDYSSIKKRKILFKELEMF